jgi:ribosomal protein S18 acetylase RimI-like enzyme
MEYVMRDATFNDADMLLKWRNQSEVRKFSRTQKIIPQDVHNSWLLCRLKSLPSQPFWIFESAIEKLGMARIDLGETTEQFRISIIIDPMHRGAGHGRNLLPMAISEFLLLYPGEDIYAEIHKENTISHKLFISCQFQEVRESNNFLILKRITNLN